MKTIEFNNLFFVLLGNEFGKTDLEFCNTEEYETIMGNTGYDVDPRFVVNY
jgi:hypothetical protein